MANKKSLLREKINAEVQEDRLREAREFADRLEFQHENRDREQAQKQHWYSFFYHSNERD